MDAERKVLREHRLQKYVRVLFNTPRKDYKIIVKLSDSVNTAYTDTLTNIVVGTYINGITNETRNLILQKAAVLHEMGHIIFTNSTICTFMSTPHFFENTIDDGRVEEGVSRLFPKARLYFIYLNKTLYPIKNLSVSIEDLTYQLIFREAKRTLGIPQLPESVHKRLRNELGDSYDFFISKTRDAVEKKMSTDAMKIMEEIWKRYYDLFHVSQPTADESVKQPHKYGSSARQMPEIDEDKKKEVDEFIENINKEKEEENDIDEKNELEKEDDASVNEEIENDKNADDETDEKEIEEDDKLDDDGEEKEDDKIDISLPSLPEEPEQISDDSILDDLEQETDREIASEIGTILGNTVRGDFSSYGNTVESYPSTDNSVTDIPDNSFITPDLEYSARKISQLFRTIAQVGDGWSHNKTRGKLEMHKLSTVLLSTTQPKIFKRKDKCGLTDLSVIIIIDGSSSMGTSVYTKVHGKILRKYSESHSTVQAIKTGYTITKALELGKYKSEVVSFYSDSKDSIYGIKSFNQSMEYCKHKFVPIANGGTPLHFALNGAFNSLSKQQSKRKLVIVITDGQPSSVPETRIILSKMKKNGIIVLGVLIKTNDTYNLFNTNCRVRCNDVIQLPSLMTQMMKNVMIDIRRGN